MGKVVAVRRKERRRDLRRRVNFDGLVNEGRITVVDISASGVGAKVFGKPGPLVLGDDGYELEIIPLTQRAGRACNFKVGDPAMLKLLKDTETILEIQVEIMRFDKSEDSLGARFIDITDEQYRIIERLVTGRPIKRKPS